MTYGVILAAGLGLRMKSKERKQFIKINKKPIIYYSIDKFLDNKKIDKIILVINKLDKSNKIILKLIDDYKEYIHSGTITIILGGKERYESVYNSLNYIYDYIGINYNDKIIIHDSARPNVDEKDIDTILKYLNKYKSITLATKLSDTIKEIKQSKTNIKEIKRTVDRDNYYLIKTPQGFNLKLLFNCYNKFIKSKKRLKITDDIQIIENFSNIKSYVLDSNPLNYKITTKSDLLLLKYIM